MRCSCTPAGGFTMRFLTPRRSRYSQSIQSRVIIVDADLLDGTWRDFLSLGKSVSDSPLVIVASGLADDRLWAEALNVGAYDVLTKPFRASEVFHSVSLAWRCLKELCEECACAASV